MEIVNFTDSVRSLSAKYIDDTNIDIKSTKVRIEQDYSIYNADILSQANDVKTGGYSTLYLSSKKYGEDILQYKQVITNTEDIHQFNRLILNLTKKSGLNTNFKKLKIDLKKNMREILSNTNQQRLKNSPIKIFKKDIRHILFDKCYSNFSSK